MGGLPRMSGLVGKLRQEGISPLLLDGGDALFAPRIGAEITEAAKEKALLIARIYKKMGMRGFVPGELDMLAGADFLARAVADAGVDLLAANLQSDGDLKKYLRPSLVVEVGGLKVAVIGITARDFFQGESAGVTFSDAVSRAAQEAASLKGKADVVVALSHLGRRGEDELSRIAGIDLILSAHDHSMTFMPKESNGKVVIACGDKGKYVARIDLSLAEPGAGFAASVKRADAERTLKVRQSEWQRETKAAEGKDPFEYFKDNPTRIKRLAEIKAQLAAAEQQIKAIGEPENSLTFSLVGLGASVPEDTEVAGWVSEYRSKYGAEQGGGHH